MKIIIIKVKINKWDLIKLKSFCIMKQTISKVKRQPSEWEKIRATDKELISKMTHTFKKLFHFTISHSHRRDFFGG